MLRFIRRLLLVCARFDLCIRYSLAEEGCPELPELERAAGVASVAHMGQEVDLRPGSRSDDPESRFERDFERLQLLGRGGFGEVRS